MQQSNKLKPLNWWKILFVLSSASLLSFVSLAVPLALYTPLIQNYMQFSPSMAVFHNSWLQQQLLHVSGYFSLLGSTQIFFHTKSGYLLGKNHLQNQLLALSASFEIGALGSCIEMLFNCISQGIFGEMPSKEVVPKWHSVSISQENVTDYTSFLYGFSSSHVWM